MRIFYFILISFFILSCSGPKEEQKSLIVQIKTLEFTRDNNPEHWKALYLKANKDEKIVLINSIAMTKNRRFLPFLDSLLNAKADENLHAKAIFAVGQTHSEEAERILLQKSTSEPSALLKNKIITALSHCGTEKSIPYLKKWISNPPLKDKAFKTAAILSRNKINTYSIKKTIFADSIKGSAYFLNNAYSRRDLNKIVMLLSEAKALQQKYFLKCLVKDYKKRGKYFESAVENDSLFTEVIKQVLKTTTDWRNSYYALQLLPAVNDSAIESYLDNFIKSSNPHLREEAYKAVGKVNDRRLPELFRNEKEWALKGILLKELAKSQPGMTYGLVMENLDRGTTEYKTKLLESLSIINDRMSRQIIHQFLNVDDFRLVNAAFDILKKRRRISNDEFEILINSDAVSTAAMSIEWKTSRKKAIDSKILLKLYAKFKSPESFDAQTEILKNFKLNKEKLEQKDKIKYLYVHAANRRIVEQLNQWLGLKNDTLSTFVLPKFISPDSVMAAIDDNVIIQIKTTRGIIKAELLPDEAPLTVFNFLHLVRNGFYDGLTFHRVVADFVIQGGDPQGDGWGGPGYFIPSEDNELPFKRGTLGIATSGFDTGGCQFFICQSEQPHLNGNYTIFGEVITGINIVDKIVPDDKIIEITIIE